MPTSVAIVDDDRELVAVLARELVRRKYDVLTAFSAPQALGLFHKHRVDVLLAELRIGPTDGLEFLGAARAKSPDTRAVMMGGRVSVDDYKRALKLGAIELLTKPLEIDAVVRAVEKAVDCETGFHGSLHGVTLIDVLQMMHFGRRSVSVQVGDGGAIHLREGEIIHAQHGPTTGEDALRELLSAHSGTVQTTPLQTQDQTIRASFDGLLLDTLRRIDEGKAASHAGVPSAGTPPGEPFGTPPNDEWEALVDLPPQAYPMGGDINRPLQPAPLTRRRFGWTRVTAPLVIVFAAAALAVYWLGRIFSPGVDLVVAPALSAGGATTNAAVAADAPRSGSAVAPVAPPTPEPDPTRHLVVHTQPEGLELRNASTGQLLGNSPVTLSFTKDDLPLRVQAVQGNRTSGPVVVAETAPATVAASVTADFQAWVTAGHRPRTRPQPTRRLSRRTRNRVRSAGRVTDKTTAAAPENDAPASTTGPGADAVLPSSSGTSHRRAPAVDFEIIGEDSLKVGTID